MSVLTDLIDFLLGLLRDPAARQEFDRDPDGTLERHGLDGLSGHDVRDARLLLADRGDVRPTPGAAPPATGGDPIREVQYTTSGFHAAEQADPPGRGHDEPPERGHHDPPERGHDEPDVREAPAAGPDPAPPGTAPRGAEAPAGDADVDAQDLSTTATFVDDRDTFVETVVDDRDTTVNTVNTVDIENTEITGNTENTVTAIDASDDDTTVVRDSFDSDDDRLTAVDASSDRTTEVTAGDGSGGRDGDLTSLDEPPGPEEGGPDPGVAEPDDATDDVAEPVL